MQITKIEKKNTSATYFIAVGDCSALTFSNPLKQMNAVMKNGGMKAVFRTKMLGIRRGTCNNPGDDNIMKEKLMLF